MLIAVTVGAVLAGLFAGTLVNRVAGRFPWPAGVRPAELVAPGAAAVRPPVLEVGTGLLAGLAALRLGPAAELPAFLLLVVVAVLLAVVDLQHRLLPDRVVLPAVAAGTLLLLGAAVARGAWDDLGRALLGAVLLFLVFLALALVSPGGLGMGDVKLSALLGLHLGWLGWQALVIGAAAGFVVQAVLALVLLAAGRVRRSSALPFGPAMLLGAALGVALAVG